MVIHHCIATDKWGRYRANCGAIVRFDLLYFEVTCPKCLEIKAHLTLTPSRLDCALKYRGMAVRNFAKKSGIPLRKLREWLSSNWIAYSVDIKRLSKALNFPEEWFTQSDVEPIQVISWNGG